MFPPARSASPTLRTHQTGRCRGGLSGLVKADQPLQRRRLPDRAKEVKVLDSRARDAPKSPQRETHGKNPKDHASALDRRRESRGNVRIGTLSLPLEKEPIVEKFVHVFFLSRLRREILFDPTAWTRRHDAESPAPAAVLVSVFFNSICSLGSSRVALDESTDE